MYDGPLVRGVVFRGNVLHNNAGIQIGGVTEDVLVEHCVVRNTNIGITVKRTATACSCAITGLRTSHSRNRGRPRPNEKPETPWNKSICQTLEIKP